MSVIQQQQNQTNGFFLFKNYYYRYRLHQETLLARVYRIDSRLLTLLRVDDKHNIGREKSPSFFVKGKGGQIQRKWPAKKLPW